MSTIKIHTSHWTDSGFTILESSKDAATKSLDGLNALLCEVENLSQLCNEQADRIVEFEEQISSLKEAG